MSWLDNYNEEKRKTSPFIRAKDLVPLQKYKFQFLSAEVTDDETKKKLKIEDEVTAMSFSWLTEDGEEKQYTSGSYGLIALFAEQKILEGDWFQIWRTGDNDPYWGIKKVEPSKTKTKK